MNIPKGIAQKLNERKEDDSLRSLSIHDGIDFLSNDYLGLSKIPFSSDKAEGATGSRLISGNSAYVTEVEQELANFFGGEAGLFYNSGYDANLGFFSAVPQKGDTIIYDTLCHASIRDGIRLSLANSFGFRHNDLAHLKDRISKASGDVFVAIEAVYSMDGDIPDLAEIARICADAGAFLVVDEAHSAGIFGEEGIGLVDFLGLNTQVFAKLITFGKAYGSHGALMVGNATLREYLINFSRPLIYTTAIAPATVNRIHEVVTKAKTMLDERMKLKENYLFFEKEMSKVNADFIPTGSPIQSLIIKGNSAAKRKAEQLNKAGFAVKAILHPTVPKNSERIRICLHSTNRLDEIKSLVKLLQ